MSSANRSDAAIEGHALDQTRTGNWPFPVLFAHRGAGKHAPENTLAAIHVGVANDYVAFEFDVKLSQEGVAILMHDDTLPRTTNGSGEVANKTIAELELLDAGSWHSAAFIGEKIPRFTAVAKYLHGHGYLANVEIKPCHGREAETGKAVMELCVESWGDRVVKPLISSFNEVALEAARKVSPTMPMGLLVTMACEDHLYTLKSLDCVSIHTHHESLDAETIRFFHEHGYRVLTYTVNDPERVALLLSWGIDGIFTDEIQTMARRFPQELHAANKPMRHVARADSSATVWTDVVPPMP
jgi:glycerophosphoryl diester phosphodiesterase